jgi:hypothetical protein
LRAESAGGGSADWWWLRSPSVSNSTAFRYFGSTGSIYTSGALGTYGVSFGFCKIKLQSGLRAESAGGGSCATCKGISENTGQTAMRWYSTFRGTSIISNTSR